MKIAIITDYFAGASNPNALRVAALVRFFCEKGAQVYVYQNKNTAPHPEPLPLNCTVINMDLRSGVGSKIGVKLWDYRIFYRIFSWIYFVFTHNSLHYNFLGHFKKINQNNPLRLAPTDAVICTAPSFGTFAVGDYLQKKFGCRFYADYRDLYTTKHHRVRSQHPSRLVYDALNRHFIEKKMVQNATAITTATATMQYELQHIFTKKTVHIIANGYDELLDIIDFDKAQNDCLKIMYFGTWVHTQDVDNEFVKGLEIFINHTKNPKIQVHFIGTDPQIIHEKTQNYKAVLPYIICHAWQPLAQGLELLAQAHVLLQMSVRGSEGIAGTKTYTYIKTKKPVLFLQPDGGEIQQIFDDLGVAIHAHTACEVAQVLYEFYMDFCNNKPLMPFNQNKNTDKYSRKIQSQLYWELIQ